MQNFRNSNALLTDLKDYLKENYTYNFDSIMIPENFKNLLSLTLQIEKISAPCIFPLYFPEERAKKTNPPVFEVDYYEALNYIETFEYMNLAHSYSCLALSALKKSDMNLANLYTNLQTENLATARKIFDKYFTKWAESEGQ